MERIVFLWEELLGKVGDQRQQLCHAWKETNLALQQAHDRFEFLTDPDLIEACIFEIQALSARNTHLLRQIKELELQGDTR